MRRDEDRNDIINNTNLWTEYRDGLCNGCIALCCRMRVEATLDDLIRMELVEPLEAQGPIKRIASRLKRQGIIDDHSPSRATFMLARRENSDCIFLGSETRRCTIYETRPETCRSHPEVGPRPGYCPHHMIV